MLNSKRNSTTFTSMISNFTAACVAAVRSYSLETLDNDKSDRINSAKVAVTTAVRRGGSLKNPPLLTTLPKKNRLSTPPDQIYAIGDKNDGEDQQDGVIDERDLPPENSPPPPPIDEGDFDENTPIVPYHQHRHPSILRAIDDLELRESASCNF